MSAFAQTYKVKHIINAALYFAVRRFDNLHCKRNIVIYGTVRQQAVILKNYAQLPSEIRNFLICHFYKVMPVYDNFTAGRQNLTEQHFKESRLSCAARAYNKNKFALLNTDVNVLQSD